MTQFSLSQLPAPINAAPSLLLERERHSRKLTEDAEPTPILISKFSPRRQLCENFIANIFFSEYHAQVTHYHTNIFALERNKKILSCCGISKASQSELFIEQYLVSPIQHELTSIRGNNIPRQSIAEIGNLVSAKAGYSRILLLLLAEVLDQANFKWMVFTGTPAIQRILSKIGCSPIMIKEASPALLKDNQNKWGSYYDSKPWVMAIDIQQALVAAKQVPLQKKVFEKFTTPLRAIAFALQIQPRLYLMYKEKNYG